MGKKPFTTKEQRFIDFYDGNATAAARKAGYKNPKRSGEQNVRKREIWDQIKKREDKRNGKHIQTREERQQFWSTMMKDAEKDRDKLKASELLGRSEADFTDKVKAVVSKHDYEDMSDDELDAELSALRKRNES